MRTCVRARVSRLEKVTVNVLPQWRRSGWSKSTHVSLPHGDLCFSGLLGRKMTRAFVKMMHRCLTHLPYVGEIGSWLLLRDPLCPGNPFGHRSQSEKNKPKSIRVVVGEQGAKRGGVWMDWEKKNCGQRSERRKEGSARSPGWICCCNEGGRCSLWDFLATLAPELVTLGLQPQFILRRSHRADSSLTSLLP